MFLVPMLPLLLFLPQFSVFRLPRIDLCLGCHVVVGDPPGVRALLSAYLRTSRLHEDECIPKRHRSSCLGRPRPSDGYIDLLHEDSSNRRPVEYTSKLLAAAETTGGEGALRRRVGGSSSPSPPPPSPPDRGYSVVIVNFFGIV